MPINQKNIVLGVCGGIAAYKSVELVRLIRKQGGNVRVIMTRNASEFVGPLTFEAISGTPVCTDLFEAGGNASIRHIEWAQSADAVVIAPATANMLAKLAHGIADDALSTFALAAKAPMLICPAMNTDMYQNRITQENIARLKGFGHTVLEPDTGELACGTTGPGRLPDPPVIFDRLLSCLTLKDFSGHKVLVTAGPTREALDPVRFISNPSSGKMGYAIARAAEYRGAEVTLISGPVPLPSPLGVKLVQVSTAAEMGEAVFAHMAAAGIIIKTAAVVDFRPKNRAGQKVKKDKAELVLELVQNEDILKEVGARKKDQILVGFAAETESLSQNAGKKLAEKNLDLIVGNIIGEPGAGFESDQNRVTLFFRNHPAESIPLMDKADLAHLILDRIKSHCMG